MRGLKGVCVAALAFVLSACANPVPPEKASYVGHWRSPNMSLEITQEGRIIYERVDVKDGRTLTKKLDSPIKDFHGDDIEVGVASISTTFFVSKKPHPDEGKWKMTVDGIELTREN